jgi:ketosteroid isomerase-like protein
MSTSKQSASKASSKTLIDLEIKFWQSMVDHDTETAVEMISEPSLMVSTMGAMKFGRDDYRKMADSGSMEVTSFELSNMEVMFPNDSTAILSYHVKQGVKARGDGKTTMQEMNDTSTWIQSGQGWECVMHTETPTDLKRAAH